MQLKKNEVHMPVTMKQFEDLTNEMTAMVNNVTTPNFLSGDYVAQILMSALHALPHTQAIIEREALFHSVLNRISCHVTYHAVEEIQRRLKVEAGASEKAPSDDGPGLALASSEHVVQ